MGNKIKKSLVIGGSGFMGPYLIRHLAGLGHVVTVTKRPSESITSDLAPTGAVPSNRYTILDLDILDKGAVIQVLEKVSPDYVFHLAAQSSVAASWLRPELTAEVNIRGCIHVLEAVRGQEKKMRVLLVGSGEEYGRILPEDLPVRESHSIKPDSIYAATKVCQNMLGAIYARAYRMDVIMARSFNHIGPGQSPQFAVSDFCRQAAQIEAGLQEAVIRTGNLDAERDFTDVRDVVRAYALLAEKGEAGQTYNVGSGCAVRIGNILQMVINQSEKKIRIEKDPAKVRPLDTPSIRADIGRIQKINGWVPKIGLSQTVQETLDYWRREVRSSISSTSFT